MTLEEAIKVCQIMSHADGGCSSCVRSLLTQFKTYFPEFDVSMEGEDLLDLEDCQDELRWNDYEKILVTEK